VVLLPIQTDNARRWRGYSSGGDAARLVPEDAYAALVVDSPAGLFKSAESFVREAGLDRFTKGRSLAEILREATAPGGLQVLVNTHSSTFARLFENEEIQVCERTGWLLHASVLLGNHYHWLLETPKANLVAGMQWFKTTYTIRFNRRHRLDGHLFQFLRRQRELLADRNRTQVIARRRVFEDDSVHEREMLDHVSERSRQNGVQSGFHAHQLLDFPQQLQVLDAGPVVPAILSGQR